jgi:hypothetical protein
MEMQVAASIDHPNSCPYLPAGEDCSPEAASGVLEGWSAGYTWCPEHFGLGAAAPPPGRGASKEWIAVQLVAFCCSDG